MSREAADGLRRLDVPEEDGLVAAGGDEAVVGLVHVEGEDFVAVRIVLVDEAGGVCGGGGRDRGRLGFGRVVEADGAVGSASEDVRVRAGGVGDGVDGASVAGEFGYGLCGEGRHGERGSRHG